MRKHRIIPSVVVGVFLGLVMLAMAARYEDFLVGKLTVENTATFEGAVNFTPSSGAGLLTITGFEAGNASVVLDADQGDDNADTYTIRSAAADNNLDILNHTTEIANLSSGGLLSVLVGIDGIGAVDLDYGSVDITDHTFVTDGTGDSEIVLPTGSISSGEILDNTIVAGDVANGVFGASADLYTDYGTVTSTAAALQTNSFNVTFGAAPVVVCTYTEDPGDVRPIFITATTASNFVASVTADKNFQWIAIGTQ